MTNRTLSGSSKPKTNIKKKKIGHFGDFVPGSTTSAGFFFAQWWDSTDFSEMGELKDLFPPGVFADWPNECLLLDTGKTSPMPITLWRKHIHGFTNATSLPNTVPKEEWIYRAAKFLKWYGVNRQHSKQNYWLGDLWQSHVHAFSWLVDYNTVFIHPPTMISMYTPAWKQVHTSGSQNSSRRIKSLFILPSHCPIVVIWLTEQETQFYKGSVPKMFQFLM